MNLCDFDVMKYIKMNNEMINKSKEEIINYLKDNNYFSLINTFYKLTEDIKTIEYNNNDSQKEIERLVNQVSKFMAYQEACMDLINNSEIMPVNFYCNSNGGAVNLSVNLIEHGGCGTTTSTMNIDNIPCIPYDKFIIRPSKLNV